jgi:alpha-methylacyl-CoA racemase
MADALAGTLDGYHVVALVLNVPGPLAGARLRALGARVTKIEPARGDPLAASSPSWYASIIAGMEVLRIDLRAHAGAATLDALLREADVLLSSVRARTLERLGLDSHRLHSRYPLLSHVAICGEAPPHDDRAGHDLTYQARAGLVAPPAMPRTLIADLAAAERAAQAAIAALLRRERTGESSHVHVSITDAATAFAQPYDAGLTRPEGELGGGLPAYNVYPSANGWIAVAALEPHFVEHLRAMLAVDDVTGSSLRDAFARRSSKEWETLAEQHDVPLCAIRA